jgi:hypothetical protein
VKTLKGAAAKSSRALAIHLPDGNAAWYTTADANPLRGSKALSSRRKDCAPRRSTADFRVEREKQKSDKHDFPGRPFIVEGIDRSDKSTPLPLLHPALALN